MVLVPDAAPTPDGWSRMPQGWYPAEGILSNILVPKIVFSVLRSSHPYTDIFIAPDVLAPLIQIWSQRNMPFYPRESIGFPPVPHWTG